MDLTLRQCTEDLSQTDSSGKENDTDNAQQELRNNKQKSGIEGAVDVALHNIYECAEAMSLDVAINAALEENLFSNAPAIWNVEDSYLSLASAVTADGIFYCILIKVDFSDKTYYVARYFEYGTFTGFYQSTAHEKIKEQIDCNELLPYCVYTEEDISLEKRRGLKLFAERRVKGANERKKWHGFRRSIFGNKTGVQESFKKVLPEFEAAGIICPFVISLCLRKKSKRYKNVCPELNKQSRYCICHPQSVSEEWENMLMAFRSSPTNKDKTGTSSLVSKKHTQLSMEDQFSVLSLLPNHHKWQWNKFVKSLRFEQRLSSTSRYYPGSPRNRIIQAFCFRNDFKEICNQCVKNILGDEQAVPNYTKRKCNSHPSQRNKKRRLENLTCGVKGKKSSSATRNVKDGHTKSIKPKPKPIINGSNEAVWLNQVEITKRKVVPVGLLGVCDVILIVEHEDYYVHKELLTDASPVFKVMLESEIFRDKKLKKIELPGKKGKDILQLLNCLYPHGSRITENTNITSLLDLSREYKMQIIKDRCEMFLLLKEPTVSNLVIAQDYGLPKLLEKCISYFSEKALIKIEEDTNFEKVSEANQIRIIKNQRNKLQDYGRRTQYIIHQMHCQSNRRPKCNKNVQHCANNDSAAVSKLEEWKKNLCSNCKLHNGRKEKLYYSCEAEKDSLGYG